jgi:hypothetical protein
MMDQHIKINLLVDTSADLCGYLRTCLREGRTQTKSEMFAANGIILHTDGCIKLRLDLGLRREF